MAEGTKHDQGKPRMSLLDPLFLSTVAQVMTFGANKYAAHNWRKGLEVSRLLDATYRHLNAFNDGQDLDPESGINHLGHAAFGLMAALWTIHNKPELDDRFKPEPKEVYTLDGKMLYPQPTKEEVDDFNTTTFGPAMILTKVK